MTEDDDTPQIGGQQEVANSDNDDTPDPYADDYDGEERILSTLRSWHHGDILTWLYHVRGLSQAEIADRLGCSASTVGRWMRRKGIESREHHGSFDIPHREEKAEYGRIRVPPAENDNVHRYEVKEHQLTALLNGQPREKVLDDGGTHVCHHRLPTKVAVNLPQVVDVVTPAEHKAITHPRDLPEDVEHWEADTASSLEEIEFKQSGVPVDAVEGLHRSRLDLTDAVDTVSPSAAADN